MKNNTTKAPLILATLNADGDEIPFRRGASPVTSNVTQQTTIIATLDEQGNPIPISMSEIDDFTTEDKAKLDKLGEDPDTGAPTWNGEPIVGDDQIIVDTFNDLPTDKIPGTEARVLTSVVANLTTGVVTSLEVGDILDAVEIPETMALVGNPADLADFGLSLIKEGSAGEDDYKYNLALIRTGGNLVFFYNCDVTSGDDDTDVQSYEFMYTPEAFIGTDYFEGVEFSAGWNIIDESGEVPSVSPVSFSEVPLIENGVTVHEVGPEAVLVYPYLQITMDVVKPEGRYILNSSSNWVLLDYASRQLVDTKVDKETGKGLSTNDYDASAVDAVTRINTTGNGNAFLSNDGTYKVLYSQISVDFFSELPDPCFSTTYPEGTIAFVRYSQDPIVSPRGYYVRLSGSWEHKTWGNDIMIPDYTYLAPKFIETYQIGLGVEGWTDNILNVGPLISAYDSDDKRFWIEPKPGYEEIFDRCKLRALKKAEGRLVIKCDTVPDVGNVEGVNDVQISVMSQYCDYPPFQGT